MTTYIPTIRLDSGDHNATVEAIRKACLESGFFYVAGHGIEIADVLLHMKLFFELPVSEKKAVADSTLSRGYTSMREETLDPANQTTGDTKEGFYVGALDIPVDDLRYNPSKLAGPNQWPDALKCPSLSNPDAFKTTMINYLDKILTLSLSISRLIAESLTLPSDYFDDALTKDPLASLRLLHYEATMSDTNAGVYSCGAHSDYGMITVLLTDENDGLQIYDKRGCKEWVPVPTITGCFVVNLGDMLERWTNGMYCSTLHRVINVSGRERYSAPFFLEPAFDTVVECLHTCCSFENPARYPPITSGMHLLEKYRETHADFTPK
jgi:isopenicillin N synthase-like dioxygenase